MNDDIIELLENLVDIIYTPDQEGLNEAFIRLMDVLMNFLSQENLPGELDINQELLDIQNAFVKKDYGELADVLHYDLRRKIELAL